MLVELRISNLAVIRESALEFGPGLNVLSGETGAGKTIIMSALGLLLGMRASAEMIRTGAAEMVVEAVFELEGDSKLPAALADLGDGNSNDNGDTTTLVIRRSIADGGRSRVLINGSLSSVNMLARLGAGLVQVYGQHEQQTLLRSESHREILDRHADLETDLAEYRAAYDHAHHLKAKLDELARSESEQSAILELARFRIAELERAQLQAGEDEELARERSILTNAARLALAADEANNLLDGPDGSALDSAARAHARVNEVLAFDQKLGAIVELIEAGRANLDEAARALADYGADIAANPARLEEIESRIQELTRLKRKHGGTIEAALETLHRARAEIQSIENISGDRAAAEHDLAAAMKDLARLADVLSERRHTGAAELSESMAAEMKTLGMKNAAFDARVSAIAPDEGRLVIGDRAYGADGADAVEFFFSPNLGQPPMPLLKIASGGELSRVMLALKRLEADQRGLPTMIFDEVVAGIGGEIAQVVGRKLKQLARFHQVLCVTHLPQIAAYADRHFVVEKRESKGATVSRVSVLEPGERTEEIARMLGGAEVSDRLRRAAREMLDRART